MTIIRYFVAFTLATATWSCGDGTEDTHDPAGPVARDDYAVLAERGVPARIDVLHNDEGDDLVLVGAVPDVADLGIEIEDDGRLRIEPDDGFCGTVQITYEIQDAGGRTGEASLTVFVASLFADLERDLEREYEPGKRLLDLWDHDGATPFEPQLVVGLVHHGRTVWKREWGGFRACSTRRPLASATKWLAASLVLHARDRGIVELDDPFQRHIPWFDENPELDFPGHPRGQSTLRQAFAMTSGLSDVQRCHTRETLDHHASVGCILEQTAMPFAPGTRVGYDGKGMQVAGLAVIEAHPEYDDWQSYATEELAGACGLHHTTFDRFYPYNPAVAGGAVSTADDILRFLGMLRDGGRCGDEQFLSAESIETMFRFHLQPEGVAPENTPVWESPWANCTNAPYGDGTPPYDCGRWPDGTDTGGSFYFDRNDTLRYTFGGWALRVRNGAPVSVISPGAYGTAPFWDREHDYHGVLFTDVDLVQGVDVAPVHIGTLYVMKRIHARIEELDSGVHGDPAPVEDLARSPTAQEPAAGEVITLGTPAEDYIDPELTEELDLIAFQDGQGDVWCARLDPVTGDFAGPPDGREMLAGSKAYDLATSFNGPEFGIDSSGWSLFFTKEHEGAASVWRSEPLGDGRLGWSPLTGQRTRLSVLASEAPDAPSVRLLYALDDLDTGQIAWLDAAAPADEHVLGDIDRGVRWIPGRRAFLYVAGQGDFAGELVLYDTEDESASVLTGDGDEKSYAFGWHAPEDNGALRALAVVDRRILRIYAPEGNGELVAIHDIDAGGVIGSPEPFVAGGTSYVTLIVREGAGRPYSPAHVFVADMQGGLTPCDDGSDGVVRTDPETYSGTNQVLVYYNVLDHGGWSIRRCATGIPIR